eukprot:1607102-Rhodomonas_salina.1
MRPTRTWSASYFHSSRTSPHWAEGKAWEKEHNKLIELRQETSKLTLDMVQQVVKLVENHLALMDSRDEDGATDHSPASSFTERAASMDATTMQSGLEEQVNIQAGTIHTLE